MDWARLALLAVASALALMLARAVQDRVALASSATGSSTASANVTGLCSVTVAPLAFGEYDPVGAHEGAASPLDSTSTASVTCIKGTSATISLDYGMNAVSSQRRLRSGANHLHYGLYQDSARTLPWGTAGSAAVNAGTAASNAPRSFTVYGRIPGGQDVPAGSYADTVTLTVNY